MPDDDKSLTVLLKTKADLKDAQALQAELEKTITRAKLLGKSFADQEAQLNRVKTAIDGYTAANGDAGEKTKLFEGHMGEVKKSIRELSHEFPVAAQALRLLTNPVGGAIALGIGMFTYAKEKLDEWNKSMEEMAQIAAKPDFIDAINARKAALEAGQIAADLYRDKMEHLIDPDERFAKAIENEKAAIQARNAAANEVSDAKFGFDQENAKHGHNLQMDMLQQQLDQGVITYDTFLAKKAAMDAEYFKKLTEMEIAHEKEKAEREIKERADLLEVEKKGLQHAADRQGDLLEDAGSARAKATEDKAKFDKAKADVAEGQSHKDDDTKAIADMEQSIYDKYGVKPDAQGNIPFDAGHAIEYLNRGDDETKYKHLLAMQEAHRKAADKVKDLPALEDAAKLSEADAARKESRAETNAQRVQDKKDQYEQDEQINAIKDKAARDALGIKESQANLKGREELEKVDAGGGYSGLNVEEMAALEQRRHASFKDPAHFKPLTDAENKSLDAFEKYVQSRGVWNQKFLDTMYQLVGTQTDEHQKLESLQQEIAALSSKLKDLKKSFP